MTQKSDIDNKSLLFEEEVHEDELVDKKNVSDVVYVESENKIKHKFLVVLAIVLLVLFIISCLLGFLFSDGKFGVLNGTVTNEYDLYVTHTNVDYGASNLAFEEHKTLNDAYVYDFSVNNSNSVNLEYSLELLNTNFDNDGIDMTMINYSLIKNGTEVVSGKLVDIQKNNLYSTTINKNSRDSYVIKLWSDSISKNMKFNFKINVIV